MSELMMDMGCWPKPQQESTHSGPRGLQERGTLSRDVAVGASAGQGAEVLWPAVKNTWLLTRALGRIINVPLLQMRRPRGRGSGVAGGH